MHSMVATTRAGWWLGAQERTTGASSLVCEDGKDVVATLIINQISISG